MGRLLAATGVAVGAAAVLFGSYRSKQNRLRDDLIQGVITSGPLPSSTHSQVASDGDAGGGRAASPPQFPEAIQRLVNKNPGLAKKASDSTAMEAQAVRFRQAVQMCFDSKKDKWTDLEGEHVASCVQPFFCWIGRMRTSGITYMEVIDSFVRHEGLLRVALLGAIPIAVMSGPETAHDELMRYVAELPWVPDALHNNPLLEFTHVDNDTAMVSCNDVSVRFRWLDEDTLEMYSKERGSFENGTMVARPWRGIFWGFQQVGSRVVPSRGEVGWIVDSEYRPYFRCTVTDYELFPPSSTSAAEDGSA